MKTLNTKREDQPREKKTKPKTGEKKRENPHTQQVPVKRLEFGNIEKKYRRSGGNGCFS